MPDVQVSWQVDLYKFLERVSEHLQLGALAENVSLNQQIELF